MQDRVPPFAVGERLREDGQGRDTSDTRPTFHGEHVASHTAAETIASQLREALIDGRIRPGDRLLWRQQR